MQQTDSKDSSANEAWDLMRHIYLMQPEEIIAVFGVPYNLVLAMEYAEVKKDTKNGTNCKEKILCEQYQITGLVSSLVNR